MFRRGDVLVKGRNYWIGRNDPTSISCAVHVMETLGVSLYGQTPEYTELEVSCLYGRPVFDPGETSPRSS